MQRKLEEYGLEYLMQLIQEAVCKALFIRIHRELGCFSEEFLKAESIHFYYDCVQLLYAEDVRRLDGGDEVTYQEFYVIFNKFIRIMKNMKVEKDSGKELYQLYTWLQDIAFDVADIEGEGEESKFHYAFNEKDIDHTEIDVQKLTKRFWSIWIVGGKARETSMKKLNRKNMQREELIFWLMMFSISNFAKIIEDDQIKELKDCVKYTKNVKTKDISKLLCWCFNCWYEMICFENDYFSEFIDVISSLRGLATLAERFDYQIFLVKKEIRDELEEFFNIPDKVFTAYYVPTALDKLRLLTLDTEFPLTGNITSTGYLSADNRHIAKYLRTIWEKFCNKWFKYDKSDPQKSVAKLVEKEKNIMNTEVNNFFAYGFHFLCGKQTYQMTNLFLAEKHMFFSQLESLVFNGEMSADDVIRGLIMLTLVNAGKEIEFDDEEDDEEAFYRHEGYISEGDYISSQILEKEASWLKFYEKLSRNEKEYCSLYWEIVLDIISSGEIKLADKMVNKIFGQGADLKEFNIHSAGYISWKNQSEDMVEKIFKKSFYQEAIESFCGRLEYQV